MESLIGDIQGPYEPLYWITDSLGSCGRRYTLETSSVKKCDYYCQTIKAEGRVVALWMTSFIKYQHAIAQVTFTCSLGSSLFPNIIPVSL